MVSYPDKMSFKQKLILCLFMTVGVLVQITPVIRSGLTYSYGVGFWGPSGHDSVWHLSLINHINDPVNINMPVYSGYKLQNYHPFFDIVISALSNFTHISSSIWLFQLYPILSSILLLSLSFFLGRLLTRSFYGGLLLLSTNALANSFGWLYSLLKFGNFSGESIFWAMQSPSNQINQPFSLSLILILILLIVIFKNQSFTTFSPKDSILIFTILSLLPITKAYSAVVGFGIFGVYSFKSYSTTRNLSNILIFTASLIFSIYIFSFYNSNSSGFLIYKPSWFLNSMIDSPDKLFIPKLSSFRNTLESLPVFDFRLILVYLTTFLIFLIGNFSWRILGLLYLFRKHKFVESSLFLVVLVLTIIPIFFIQKGTSWNTIQFLYYALFLSNILLSLYLFSIKHNFLGKLLIAVIFINYFVAFLGMSSNYLGKIPPAALSSYEKNALDFLSYQPKGNVLTVPYDKYLKSSFTSTPIPIYAYETTAYVSAYSRQLTFLEDEMNVENSGFDYQSRRQQSLEFFKQQNVYQNRGFLVNNKINYIYLAGLQKKIYTLDLQNLYLTRIFENPEALIYRVQR